MSIRAGHMVANVDFGEEVVEFLIFTSPVCLDGDYLPIKETLQEFFEFNKIRKHLGFKFQRINLGEFTVIINKAHVVLFVPNRFRRIAPNIGIEEF
jgi:hypothetical protein